jgi:xanthosine utilization system XapX-like protein
MRFLDLVRGRSTPVRDVGNVGILGILGLLQNEQVMGLVSGLFGGNAEVMAVLAGITAIFNLFQRTRTEVPLSER